ncbi:hypothetical protein KC906_01765, partial [Candidatus Kaiserbacteria bacterium]|nr:hypothetical protein [Candidatus Kaiserbacteria bacterium]
MNGDQHNIKTPDFEGEEMKMPENTDMQPPVHDESRLLSGPLLLVLALLLVAILAGLYYWFTTLESNTQPLPTIERPTREANNEPESTTAEAQADTMMATSPSDELSAIEADIEATDLESLDAELNAIEAEFDAAV